MQVWRRAVISGSCSSSLNFFHSNLSRSIFRSFSIRSTHQPPPSFQNGNNDDRDEWSDAWESAWIPEDSVRNRAPWETDVNFTGDNIVLPSDVDLDTKAFVQDMDDNWNDRRGRRSARASNLAGSSSSQSVEQQTPADKLSANLSAVETLKKDYRLKKQRIHAALWMKEIEKEEEARLGSDHAAGDIDRLLDSCSEIFESSNSELNDSKVPSTNEFKAKPDGWESTSVSQEGSVWEMSQREEDVLLQEFERRIAFCKFQIASFIKQHIFSRRRPIDGWKYMIEELGPNAKKGKGSVLRLPTLSDASTQPFREEKPPIARDLGITRKGRHSA